MERRLRNNSLNGKTQSRRYTGIERIRKIGSHDPLWKILEKPLQYKNIIKNVMNISLSRPEKMLIKFWCPPKMWLIYEKKMNHAKYFFCNAKIATTQALQKNDQLPYRSQKFIATEVWLHGASRKGLEE